MRTAAGDGDARLRHADRRRRLASTTTSATRNGRSTRPSSRRSRARCTSARRSCGRSRPPRWPTTRRERRAAVDVRGRRARGRPASRWPGRSPRSRATRAATSARSTPRQTRVLLVEAGDRVLAAFPPKLSKRRPTKSLGALGVTPLVDHMVTGIDADGVTIETDDGEEQRARRHRHLGRGRARRRAVAGTLAEASGAETDKVGRLLVEPDLTLPGHPEVLAIGDMVQVRGGDPLPGVAPVAMQMGRYAAQARPRPAARTRRRAVQVQGQGQPGDDRARAGGGRAAAAASGSAASSAWALWLGIHLFYLSASRTGCWCFIRWGVQLPHARARDAADHRRAEYALAVILRRSWRSSTS